MGMFDTVVVEGLKLPKLPSTIESFLKKSNASIPNDFQTKDLENALLTFYIDSKGQIYEERRVATGKRVKRPLLWEAWKDNRSFIERMYFKFIDKKFLTSPYKELRTIPELKVVKKKSNITNTFNFYTFSDINGRYLDVEYKAEAVNGKVKSVILLKSELESEADSRKRRAANEEFDKKMIATVEARRRFVEKWYYPLLKEVYNPFVFFGKKAIQYFCTKLINWTYRWHSI